jgi:hypothetical protein
METNENENVLSEAAIREADKKLDEKQKTDKKKFTKKEVKAIKDKAKGVNRADSEMECAICGNPILKGQAFKTLPADGKNGRRHYHQATCSPGSPNWMKLRGDKAKIKPSKIKAKANHGKRTMNKYGHVPGSGGDKIDELLEKGITMNDLSKRNFSKSRIQAHISQLRNRGFKVIEKNDIYTLN